MSLKRQYEFAHPPGPEEWWNESYYCNFFDSTGKWGGVTRVGLSPNKQLADGLLCLYFPDGAVGVVRTQETLLAHSSEVRAGPLVHERLEPLKRWRIRYDGPIYHFKDPRMVGSTERTQLVDLPRKEVALDLTFEGLHEPYDFNAHMRKMPMHPFDLARSLTPGQIRYSLLSLPTRLRQGLRMSRARHYEQAGALSGTLRVDNESVEFRGTGQRDHSWGVRDWKVPARWRWFVCQFEGNRGFNAVRVELFGMTAVGGYLWGPRGLEPVSQWKLENTFDATGRGGKDLRIICQVNGRTEVITGTVQVNIPLTMTDRGSTTVVNEGRAVFDWNGATGYGVSEFLEQVPS